MLIGTAGHIDHGKTTLIRALTGVNTDRLPEEQRRGISIDLGFAYLPVPVPVAKAMGSELSDAMSAATLSDGADQRPDTVIGFIDVPGHEKFVPTMLAGAAGIDFALLVIAADDGPMPQTREHLDILNLLGITRAAVVLTKVDRATPEQTVQAEAAIHQLLRTSALVDAPIFPVVASTGEGVAALREHLFSMALTCAEEECSAHFRLAVDRSFSLSGAGTVVTGTVMAGKVRVGDTLRLQALAKKSGQRHFEVRVRSIHANNRPAAQGSRGMRCAINLVGIGEHLSHQDIERGDWLLAPELDFFSGRLDVELQALPGSEKWLRPGVDLHLHHGAQHLMGKLVPLDVRRAWYQLVTNAPLLACSGDRLIVRDASGQQTLAGARVIDPEGPARHRAKPERLAQLAALNESTAARRLSHLLDASPYGVELARFARGQNCRPETPVGAVPVAGWLFAPAHAAALAQRVLAALETYHAHHPDELGLERERLRRIAAPQLDQKLFAGCLAHWKTASTLAQTGNAWHLPAHRVELSKSELGLAASVLPALAAGAFDPPWVRDLAALQAVEDAEIRQLLRKLAAQGEVFQVVKDLFYHHEVIGQLGAIALRLAGPERQPIKAAALRDATQLGRKRAIQILEFFDRVGFTRRVGVGQQQAHALRGDPPVG